MSSNVRTRVQFNPMSSKYYSVEQASKLLPLQFVRVRVSSCTSRAIAAAVLETVGMWERLMLVHVMHIGAGVAPLVYFTRAKRLLKSSSVTRNRGYAKAEFRREGAKAGRREGGKAGDFRSVGASSGCCHVSQQNRPNNLRGYDEIDCLFASERPLARNMACQR